MTAPASRAIRALERVALVFALGGASFLALRTPVPGKYDPLPVGVGALVAYVVLVVGIALVVRALRRRGTRWAWASAVVAGFALLLLTGMVHARVKVMISESGTYDHWPPRLEDIRATRIDSMDAKLRAAWGVRLAAHRITDSAVASGVVSIPPDWPFPADVTLAMEPNGGSHLRLWARTANGAAVCMSVEGRNEAIAGDSTSHGCPANVTSSPALAFRPPLRSPWVTPPRTVGTFVGAPWPQYRRDAAKSGATPEARDGAAGWATTVPGEMRASVSVVGEYVLVGAHGTGAITALARATGGREWGHHVPNWLHQDAVSDGRVAVVGFGDNLASFSGRAPSGVAAYEVATGRHLWTGFDEGSVMTSPIIRNSFVVYGTGVGILRKRALATGAVEAEGMLAGMVTMAPPASVGDTIVFSLDHDRVCALLISDFRTLWCRTMPHLRMMGHAAPTIRDGSVIVSGAGTLLTPSMREFIRMPRGLQWRLVRSAIVPTVWDEFSGQLFASLRLRDGALRWVSPLYANPRPVVGHIAGTAVIAGDIGVIVLPIADTLVAFDHRTGRTIWTAHALNSRGPPLLVDGHVVVAGRDGVIESRSLATGAITCTTRRPIGFDRAGPTLAGGLLIFADLEGRIEAIPAAELLSCAAR